MTTTWWSNERSKGGLFASESLCKTIHELFTLVFCVQKRLHIAPPNVGVRCIWKYGKVKQLSPQNCHVNISFQWENDDKQM